MMGTVVSLSVIEVSFFSFVGLFKKSSGCTAQSSLEFLDSGDIPTSSKCKVTGYTRFESRTIQLIACGFENMARQKT